MFQSIFRARRVECGRCGFTITEEEARVSYPPIKERAKAGNTDIVITYFHNRKANDCWNEFCRERQEKTQSPRNLEDIRQQQVAEEEACLATV